ncbi:UNKNOWN [Stylonychia lemnae]|uniref:Uncharacterized protein n=1 Tax=Stylonychia lemnae TaxID=5949 RepID=A0A078B2D3_STYLE|nr:UNKNOWN [Stylonychia lemnae]|eukprot:CDW88654.1 UNKNOWN [Stylonychia lemnae]
MSDKKQSFLSLKPTEIIDQIKQQQPKSIISKGNKKVDSKGNSLRVSVKNSNRNSNNDSQESSEEEDEERSSGSSKNSSPRSSSPISQSSESPKNQKQKRKSTSKKRKSSSPASLLEEQEDEEEEEELVKFNMNFTQLNEYLNNMIKVINQHAKLLNTLNKEIQVRTTEQQIGDIFTLISTGLPYELLIKKLGGQPPTRRGSVMKLLGDASMLPPGFQIAGDRLTNLGHQKQSSIDEMSFGVQNQKIPSKSQLSILEGTERFLRATELMGKYLVDFKEYSHQNDCQIIRIDTELSQRVTKVEFQATLREKSKKLKNKLKNMLDQNEKKMNMLEQTLNDRLEEFKKKLSEVELNTYWKIKDYEDLLAQRVSETYMRDYVRGENNKVTRDYKEWIEKEQSTVFRRIDQIDIDMRRIREAIGDQIGELQKGTDTFTSAQDLTIQLKQIGMNLEKMQSDLKHSTIRPAGSDLVDSEKFQELLITNEKLQKKLQKVSKKFKKFQESSKLQAENFEKELQRKAEKDSLIQNQQQFFDNLTQMENETDASITKLVGEELRKLGEQIANNNKVMEKKIAKVYADVDVEKLQKQIEKKANKEEIRDKLENWEVKVTFNDKANKNMQNTVSRLEIDLVQPNLQRSPTRYQQNLNPLDQLPILQNVHSVSVYDHSKIDFPSPLDQIKGRVYGDEMPKSINNINNQFNSRHSNTNGNNGGRPTSSSIKSTSNKPIQKNSLTNLNSNAGLSGVNGKISLGSNQNAYMTHNPGMRPQTQDNSLKIGRSNFGNASQNNSTNVIKGGPLNKLLNLSSGEISQAVGVTNKTKLSVLKSKHSGYQLSNEDNNLSQVERVFRNAGND